MVSAMDVMIRNRQSSYAPRCHDYRQMKSVITSDPQQVDMLEGLSLKMSLQQIILSALYGVVPQTGSVARPA